VYALMKLFTAFLSHVVLGIILLISYTANAQLLETRISITFPETTLDHDIAQLQKATGIPFAYEASGLSKVYVRAHSFKNARLKVILRELLQYSDYIFQESHEVVVIGPKKTSAGHSRSYLLKAVIEDKKSGERLKGVAVYDPRNNNFYTYSDDNGYFSMPTGSDTLQLRLSYLSYKPVEIALKVDDAVLYRIKMEVAVKDLDSILIIAPGDIKSYSDLTKISASGKNIPLLPGFSGDMDLLNLIKVTPGIAQANDGSGNFIVRGGAPDQNLMLLDGFNIYTTTHLFGLISTVNAHAVNDVNIYKGAFPSRYSGRISSVYDIASKKGDPEQYHGRFSLGTTMSEFYIEGPIRKSKSGFLLAARRSYHDQYIRQFTPGITFYFQDLNCRFSHRLSENDQLYFSGYLSGDYFQFSKDAVDSSGIKTDRTITLQTKNNGGSICWKHRQGAVTTDFTMHYSGYKLYVKNDIASADQFMRLTSEEQIQSGLYEGGAKLLLSYVPNKAHTLEAGLYYTKHSFDPNMFTISFTSSDTSVFPNIKDQQVINDPDAYQSGIFIEDNFSLGNKIKASAGIHGSFYHTQSTSYFFPQPRMSLRYLFEPGWSLCLSYARMQQSLLRISISQTSLPVDFWIPSSGTMKPQMSDQVSIGVDGKIKKGLFHFGAEGYYKNIRNITDYLILQAASPLNPTWGDVTTTGSGAAYGVECSITKSRGTFHTYLSYALSWSTRNFPEINNGHTFFYKYDRRHNINFVNTYKLGKFLELSTVFSFQSKPRPPVLIIKTTDMSQNAEELKRMAAATHLEAYHRLDAGINWTTPYTDNIRGTWSLNVLNVYNRENAFYYFSNGNGNQLAGVSLLPLTVALAYSLNF